MDNYKWYTDNIYNRLHRDIKLLCVDESGNEVICIKRYDSFNGGTYFKVSGSIIYEFYPVKYRILDE